MNTLVSFHGDQAVKDKYLTRVRHHRELDHLLQGIGWSPEDLKGCAIGCTLENYDHSRFPVELGLPEWLAHLEDHIFEYLSVEDSKSWPHDLLEALPVGVSDAKMAKVRDGFQIFWLERQKTHIDQSKYLGVAVAIDTVVGLLQSSLDGSEPESAAWSAAWSAAESAAWSAAESAAESAAWSAAESAAWSAARSAKHNEARIKRDWLLAAFKALNPETV